MSLKRAFSSLKIFANENMMSLIRKLKRLWKKKRQILRTTLLSPAKHPSPPKNLNVLITQQTLTKGDGVVLL